MAKDQVKVKATRKDDGIEIQCSIEGFSPNEFREAMFNVIAEFTADFNNSQEEK